MTSATPEKVKDLLASFLVKSPTNKDTWTSTSQQNSPETTDQVQSQISQESGKKRSLFSGALRSYDKFLERLESFSSVTWFDKPVELNPLECCRYGWENVDTDMLLCVGCNAFLSGHLPSKREDPAAYKESVAKLKKSLQTAHDKFCVLAANPCPEYFSQVACHDPASLVSDFVERATSVASVQDRLPTVDFTQLNDVGYDAGQAGAYCKRHLMPDQDLSLETVALAVTGWTLNSSSADILQCSKCRRKLGLWNYTPKSGNGVPDDTETQEEKEEEDVGDEPTAKRRKMIVKLKPELAPIEEHRLWCPWLKATRLSTQHSQKNKGDNHLPAWMVALRVMAPGLVDIGLAHAMKTSPMTDGLRCFRHIINTWSSPQAQPEKSST